MPKYSDVLMDHFSSPRNAGKLENADRVGTAGTPGHGPFMVIYLKLEANVISDARYQTYGCGPAIAAGSVLTETIIGKTSEQCLTLTDQGIAAALGGLPPDKFFCASLAVQALRSGLGV